MKKKLILALFLCVLCFAVAACAGGGGENSSADTQSEQTPDTEQRLIVNSEGTDYVFVFPTGVSYIQNLCNDMKYAAFEATYQNIFVRADSKDEQQYEIVVGITNRKATFTAKKGLEKNQYRIVWVGDKLVVAGGTNHSAWQGAMWLKEKYFTNIGDAGVSIPADIDVVGTVNDLMTFDNFKEGWSTYVYEKYGVSLSFAMFIPYGYSSDKEYPLLLNLHGDGNVGKDVLTILENGEVTFGRRAAAEYKETIVIVPASTKTWMEVAKDTTDNIYKNFSFDSAKPSTELETVMKLIDECLEKMAVDANRLYISGYSKGCMSSWYLMSKYPDKFAAAAIACGSGDVTVAEKIAHIPIWVFMGDVDTIVSYDSVKEMYDAYTAAGGRGKFTTCTGLGHGVSSRLQSEAELITWLYSQEKK